MRSSRAAAVALARCAVVDKRHGPTPTDTASHLAIDSFLRSSFDDRARLRVWRSAIHGERVHQVR